jgi:antitoxin MazE
MVSSSGFPIGQAAFAALGCFRLVDLVEKFLVGGGVLNNQLRLAVNGEDNRTAGLAHARDKLAGFALEVAEGMDVLTDIDGGHNIRTKLALNFITRSRKMARAEATGKEISARYTHCRYMRTSTQIARWGNSLGLRLPKAVALEARIGEGDTVEVSVKEGEIIVRPAQSTYSLHELVSKITARNRHGESDWGKPKGHEQW